MPRALAQRTRDEFYPKESLQLAEVRGLDLTLKQAAEFKYISSPLSVADVQERLIDILYKGSEAPFVGWVEPSARLRASIARRRRA